MFLGQMEFNEKRSKIYKQGTRVLIKQAFCLQFFSFKVFLRYEF